MRFTKLKKFLSIFMVVAMFFGIFPTSTWAQTPQPEWAEWNETADDAVTVTVSVSKDGAIIIGNDDANTRLNRVTVTVPYFDLALYGLETFNRTPADDPNGKVIQRPTMLHAQIYLLERYYFGLAEEDCGQGKVDLSQNRAAYTESINGTQELIGSGAALAASGSARTMWQSSFWGCNSGNVHYFRNHADGLISYTESDAANTSGWYNSISATADYFLLEDGDTLDMAVFTTSPWNGTGGNAYMENYETSENVTLKAGDSYTWTADFFDTNWANNSEVPLSWHVYDSTGSEVHVSESTSLEFSYTFENPGTYTVVGYDAAYGQDSCIVLPAVASVTVEESDEPAEKYEVTINVAPSAANVTFYEGANAETELTAGVTDNGIVGDYHQYVLNVPEGMYSYRGVEEETNLGGMAFEIPFDEEVMSDGSASGKGQTLTLTRVNYYTTSNVVTEVGDYSLRLLPGSLPDAVTGEQYIDENGRVVTPVMVTARGNALVYQAVVDMQGDLAETHAVAPISNITFKDSVTTTQKKTFSVKEIVFHTITAPAGAEVQMFNQLKNFNVTEIEAKSSVANSDGTVTYTFATPGGSTLTYRVSMDGKITRAGYMSSKAENISITFEEDENPKATENIMDNANMAKRIESSTMLNVNSQNNLPLGVGEEFRLRAYRGAWQIVNSDTANIMIEPDFHYEVISGGEHISITPVTDMCTGNAKNNWYDITGVSEGTAVIEVSYDAIIIGGNGTSYDGQYGATDPYRTSLFVINIGGSENTLSMTADGSVNQWDTEYDTVYFTGETGNLTFSAALAGEVPEKVELSADKGATWTEVPANEGKYTANGLVSGNNILRFTKGDTVEYQVVRAAKVTYTVTNTTRTGDEILEGDTLKIVFSGLYTPVAKFSGIYNPGFGQGHKVTYTLPENVTAAATGGQYDFISTNTYLVTIDTYGEVTLTGGHVAFNVMGVADPLGGHRILTDAGTGTNFSAVSTQHTRGILPDLTFVVAEMPSIPVTVESDVENAAIVITNEDGEELTGENDVYTLDYGTYKYVASADGYITERSSFTVGKADGESKTVSIKMRKVEGAVWDGTTVTEVTPNEEGIYEISTGAELAWFAQQVNAGNGTSWNAVLTDDISLGGFAWTPMVSYAGTFDGDGHMIMDLYIESASTNQGFFASLETPGVIQNLGVSGSVTSTNSYTGGIVGRLQADTTVRNCVNYADVSGKQNVGGIAGLQIANTAKIINCCNMGDIVAESKLGGGISGGTVSAGQSPYIENSYSTGTVTCPTNGGALTGSTGTANIINSYYLSNAFSGASKAGTEKTEEELKALAAILGEAYADDTYSINEGYPVLTWQEDAKHILISEDAVTEASITTGALYFVDLSTIFTDMKGHDLIYTLDQDYGTQTKIVDGKLVFSVSEPGVYTPTVTVACADGATASHTITLTVEKAADGDPEAYDYDETAADQVTVTVTVSNDGKPIAGADGTPISHLEITVPYFDLADYGLEEYYRYHTENGQGSYVDTEIVERPTALHLFIYMIEHYYLGIPWDQCGSNSDINPILSYSSADEVMYFDGSPAYTAASNALTPTQNATSLFLTSFWGHDMNLMYYRNHRYPLMSPGWGATADYILLSDGDTIDIGLFTDYSFYLDGCFMSFDQETYNVEAGDSFTVTTNKTSSSADKQSSSIELITEEMEVILYDEDWNPVDTAEVTSAGDGKYDIQAPDAAGTYYVMAMQHGAGTDNANKAPATAKVIVEEKASEQQKEMPYTDVNESDWHLPYVEDVYQKNLMTGLNETTFGPNENLSRAQFAVILYRMEGSPEVSYSNTYPDIADDIWYTDAVMWASENGIVTGYSNNGYFGPADDITREQMATMLYRYAEYKEYDTDTLADLAEYSDADKVSEFAETGMAWCVENEIISGDGITGELLPQGVTSRAVCAAMISRFTDAF